MCGCECAGVHVQCVDMWVCMCDGCDVYVCGVCGVCVWDVWMCACVVCGGVGETYDLNSNHIQNAFTTHYLVRISH